MENKLFDIEPIVLLTEVVVGDKITLSFPKSGYLYFQPISINKDACELFSERHI